MDADRGIKIRVRLAHDRRGGTASGQTCDVRTSGIDAIVTHDLLRDAGDQGRFAGVTLLVL